LLLGLVPWLAGRAKLDVAARVRALHLDSVLGAPSVDWREVLGVRKGDPLFGTWTRRSAKTLSENPRVASATVARSMTGEVFVQVAERRAAAILNLNGLKYVDTAGHVLGPVGKADRWADLPVISGPWKPVSDRDLVRGRVLEAMELVAALKAAGIPEREISELHFEAARGWLLFRVGLPAPIAMGDDGFPAKAQRIARVLRDLRGREDGVKELNADFDDRVIVKVEGVDLMEKER
jgi:cell division protein FtsQ